MWDFNLHLERLGDRTLFTQIAQAVVDDICRGRLRSGDRLPGTRTLARTIGVDRVTVLAAYDELAAEGWVTTHPAQGTFVSRELPDDVWNSRGPASGSTRGLKVAAFPLPSGPSVIRWLPPASGMLAFRSSHPDTRLVPVDSLTRAYRRVLRGRGTALLGYGEPEGHPRLRRAVSQMLRETRALGASTENVLVTRGSQMALSLVSRALIRPGDTVVIEEPGYPHAWETFKASGAKLVPMRVTPRGLDVASLARLAKRGTVRAVYVTPHHQLPTTATLSSDRRRELIALARTHRFAVLEDDYDHEFHYDRDPIAPLASLDPGIVIYIGTFSKVLAPGLRIGYLAAATNVVNQLSAYRQALDLQGDPAMEAALAELIENDDLQRHIRRVKRAYRSRRDRLAALLEARLRGAVSFTVPAGGIGLWARTAPDIGVDEWVAAAARRGAAFLTGRAFTLDRRPLPFIRLGYACLNDEELGMAVSRMAAALPEARTTRSTA
jgi:GntR family transcriptional regulator/MocR family aminotransferase